MVASLQYPKPHSPSNQKLSNPILKNPCTTLEIPEGIKISGKKGKYFLTGCNLRETPLAPLLLAKQTGRLAGTQIRG